MAIHEQHTVNHPDEGSEGSATRQDGLNAIMEAARDVFAERGYHGASIREIAKRAGLSLSALYYYYSGKQELLFSLIDDGFNDYFRTCARKLAHAPGDPALRLAALVRATVDYRIRRPMQSQLVLAELRNLSPEYHVKVAAKRNEATGLFQQIIDEGVQAGVFRTPYPAEARRGIIAMCNAISQWYEPTGEFGVTEIEDRHVRLTFALVEYDIGSERHDRRKSSDSTPDTGN